MASGRKRSCKQDPDNPAFCTGGTTCNFCYPSLLNEEDSLDGFNDNNGFEPLFHSHFEYEHAVPQDSFSSLPQPVGAESSSFQESRSQTGDVPGHSLSRSSFTRRKPVWTKIGPGNEEDAKRFESRKELFKQMQELSIFVNQRNPTRKHPINNENQSLVNRDLLSPICQPIVTENREILELQGGPNMHSSATTANLAVMPNQRIANEHIIEMDEGEYWQSSTIITRSSSPNTWDGWVENRDLHLSTGQLTTAETCEIQRSHSLHEAAKLCNEIEHQIPDFHQQSKEKSTILSGLRRGTYTRPFPASYFSLGCNKLNTNSSRRSSERVGGEEHIEFSKPKILRMCRRCNLPFGNLHAYQRVNIVLYGPAIWSSELLKTFSSSTPCRFEWPCSLSYQMNIIRGKISTSVFVWQAEDLEKSGCRIRDLYNTSKTTIVVVKKSKKSPYFIPCGDLVQRIRHEVDVNVPIILVVCRTDEYYQSKPSHIRSNFIMHGHRLKAKYNLSEYIECTVYSKKVVKNVFSTAMDVSQQKYLTM